MRIAFLEQLPRFVGGSERMSLSLCRFAAAHGHSTWLAYAEAGDMVAAYETAGAACRRLPVIPIAVRRPLEAWRSFWSLLRFVRRERIDVIFTSQVSYASLMALVGRCSRARTAMHLGLVYDYASPVFRAGMKRLDLGVAPSQHTAEGWRARNWPVRSLRVIQNGIDTAVFSPGDGRQAARRRLDVGSGALVVAYVGRLVQEKGIFTLLRAFARYRLTPRPGQLMFVGAPQGHEIDQLKELAVREGLPSSDWKVLPPTATTEDVYRAADVVVVPSEWDEPFGLVPLEAMACGTLTVVSDRGMMPAFVAPLDGAAVFAAGNVEALGEKLTYWLADAERREAAAAVLAARTRSEFGFEACGKAYMTAFQSLLAS